MNSLPRPQHVGILAMATYFPHTYVEQSDLETFDHIPSGKYTRGLGQTALGYTGDREDINSIALTVCAQLMEQNHLNPMDIGRLEVGTETLVDKSKSTKTVLMELFAASGNTDIEGVTCVNACYGGTAALFNAASWVEGSGWDGRYAIVIAADIAVYDKGPARPSGGCGAVAMLVGPDAPLVVDMTTRTTNAAQVWDFYKPDPSVEWPTVDGHHSQTCYLRALDDCFLRFCAKHEKQLQKQASNKEVESVESQDPMFQLSSMDYMLFHSPYNKLVQIAFAHLWFLNYRRVPTLQQENDALKPWVTVPLEDTYTNRELDLKARQCARDSFKKMVAPFHAASQLVGNMYTASVYFNLATLISTKAASLNGHNIAMFSYGSGSMASMFSLKCRLTSTGSPFSLENMASTLNLFPRLASRKRTSAVEFNFHMGLREQFHGKKSIKPKQPYTSLLPGTYYLVEVDNMYRRTYARWTGDDVVSADNLQYAENQNQECVAKVIPSKLGSNQSVIVTGISAGLPGRPHPFSGDSLPLDHLINGTNCISALSTETIDSILARNIVVQKRVPGQTSSERPTVKRCLVSSREECIQVAAIMSNVDLVAEYGVNPSFVDGMDECTQLGVAAGLEALKNAGLVSGEEGQWTLPTKIADSTGVIYASAFPAMHATASEVARFGVQGEKFALDRKLLFRTLVLANAQLAQLIGARGPNTLVDAACAGMTQAIALAKDWIALRRCDRVVVIGSDVASSNELLPYIGGGFRILGAASTAPTVEEAALPFDARRNGMIVGSGAAGLVIESANAIQQCSRNVHSPFVPTVQLLAAHYVNSAYHGATIHIAHLSQALLAFFADLERDFGISRDDFVKHGVYYSHETFTNSSPKASCAYAEIQALRDALGDDLVSQLLITNTKGFTGHPMGVSFEDIAAVEGLRRGCVPPVVNFQVDDAHLGPKLRLAQGGAYEHQYALRVAAGFGSQVVLTFYARV